MSLDVRDEKFWFREARRRALSRRLESYAAALMPNLKQAALDREMATVTRQLYELDNEENIEEVERAAQKRLADLRNPRPPVKRTRRTKSKKRQRRL